MPTVTLKQKPPKGPRAEGKPFRGFTLDDATDAQIDALAGKYKMSRSELIRSIVGQIYEGEFGKGGAA